MVAVPSSLTQTQLKQESCSGPGASLPRILIVAPSMRIMGGQAVAARQLLTDLQSENAPVGFLPINPQLPSMLAYAERLKFVRTMFVSASFFWHLFRIVPNYDVIHIFSASYFSFVISQVPAILVGRAFSKKILLNYHSGECEDHLNRWGKAVYWFLNKVDRIVVQSPYLVEAFAHHGFSASPIANVVDVKNFPHQKRDPFQPKILVARMLSQHYNVACAIRAFAHIQQQLPQAELTILGDGPQETALKQLVQDLNLANISFPGRIERDQIAAVFDDHDVFLNSSNVDNMPVSILEAFASGLVVVTTCAGGIPYLVQDGETGHLAPLDDHECLANKVLHALRHQDETRAITLAAMQSLQRFRWQSVRDHWFTVYRELAASKEDIDVHLD